MVLGAQRSVKAKGERANEWPDETFETSVGDSLMITRRSRSANEEARTGEEAWLGGLNKYTARNRRVEFLYADSLGEPLSRFMIEIKIRSFYEHNSATFIQIFCLCILLPFCVGNEQIGKKMIRVNRNLITFF